LKDFALAITHTIVFHRSLGIPKPNEERCNFLNASYMRCGEETYEKQIDQKVEQMLENIPRNKEDEINLTFYS